MNARELYENVVVELGSRTQVNRRSARLPLIRATVEFSKKKQNRISIPVGVYLQVDHQSNVMLTSWDYLIGNLDDENRYVLKRRKRRLSPRGWLDPGGI